MNKFFLLLLAGAILFTGCSSVESAGQKAPNFSLPDINNSIVRLSDYERHVIILNFFATWCPPCKTEIPDFVELVNDYRAKDFIVIGISVDREGAGVVSSFAAQYGINYPVLMDDGLVSDAYGGITSIPTTFIIDRDGNIVEKIIGSRRKSYFEGVIKPLL